MVRAGQHVGKTPQGGGSTKTLSSRIVALAERLTRPHSELTDMAERHQARLVAALSLLIFTAVVLLTPFSFVTSTNFQITLIATVELLTFSVIGYWFSRRPRYRAGVLIIGLAFPLLLGMTLFFAPLGVSSWLVILKYLTIPSVLVISSLKWQSAAIVIGACAAAIMACFALPNAPVTQIYSYLVFFFLISALAALEALLTQRYRRQIGDSEARYRSVIAALTEGILIIGRDGVIQTVNAAAERILGFSSDKLVGLAMSDPAWQTIREDGSPFTVDDYPVTAALRTGEPQFDVILGVHQPSGSLRWLSINTQPLIAPGETTPYAVVASFTDITDRKRAEAELLEAHDRYYGLFNQSHDAVFILALDGTGLESNARGADLFGYTLDEIQTLNYRDLSAEWEPTTTTFERLLAGERLPTYERLARKKDGTVIPVEINAELVRDADGKPMHLQSVIRDISARKEADQRSVDLTLERERVALLMNFIRAASHEFRTPLASINTSAYLMARLDDRDVRAEKLRQIEDQVRRITNLLDRLLLVARLKTDIAGTQRRIDMEGVIDAVRIAVRARHPDCPTIVQAIPLDLPLLRCEPDLIHEAVLQLMDNACRFTPSDGVVTVRVSFENEDENEDEHENEGGAFLITISDTGAGIPPEMLPRVFESFWRLDTVHQTSGLGLGLTIAQAIAERHNGTLTLRSVVGIGTTVELRLPTT